MEEDELTLEQRDLSIKAGEKQSMVFASTVKAVNSEKGTVDVIMSDASIDRYREVIDPRAWKKGLANYKKHPVLLSSHNYHGLTNQIGKAETIKVNKDGQLEARMKYFVGKGNPEADWGFFLAEEGVAAYSVGFIPKGYVYNSEGEFEDLAKELGYSKKEAAGIRVIFTDVELLENSHVLVPANPAGLLKGMESEEVKNDTLLKSLYKEALDKVDSFKDFFETEGAATISKNFGIGGDDKVDGSGRVKRAKKDGVLDIAPEVKGEIPDNGAAQILDAIKGLLVKPEDAQKEADLAELIASLKELEGLEDNSEEVAAFWSLAAEKGFSVDEVLAAVDTLLESGGPASPESKDASADIPEGELNADENPINDDGSVEVKDSDELEEQEAGINEKDAEELEAEEKDLSAEDAAESVVEDLDLDTTEQELSIEDKLEAISRILGVSSSEPVEEEELSPEVAAIKTATDDAIAKINAAFKTASEQFSSLTIESTKTTEKLEAFESDLGSVKDLLTDLEENKIDVKEAAEVSRESMRVLLAGIKLATSKIGAKEVPAETKD